MQKTFMFSLILSGLMLFCGISSTYAQQEGNSILGVWYNTEKDAKIEIYNCEDKICGKIVWMEDPQEADGRPKLDGNNPNEELQILPVLGLNLLTNFELNKKNEWDGGKIYDPKNGKTYSCVMKLQKNGDLEVRGYVGFSLLGRTVTWTRAE